VEPTYRELFRAIMNYGDFDRMPVLHWTGWPETNERWQREAGIAPEAQNEYFDAKPFWHGIGPEFSLYPPFEEEIIEDTDEYVIKRGGDGVVFQDWKHASCIPHYIDFTLKDRGMLREFVERLQPHPDRLPGNADELVKRGEDAGMPIGIFCGSMIGFIRNWMGVENLAVACFEDPDMIGELVEAASDMVCATIEPLLQKHQFDLGYFWEDICGKSGPLVTIKIFKELVVPGYKKITRLLKKYGVELASVDSDGWIEPLVPYWLEAGVNIMFPFEIGTWNADPTEYRRKYGRDLRIFGGFNKLVLEKGPAEIDAELERRLPLAAEGGYVIFPDHLITPGTSVENYKYYLEKLRAVRF